MVGLGNPGAKHERQRHNVGFMAIDAIAHRFNAPNFREKNQGLVSEIEVNGRKIILVKPQTFMNRSGICVGPFKSFYKLDLSNIIVFYDELDLEAGKFRLRQGGGLAGHNGLRSLKEHIGNDFKRARIGIGHPGDKERVLGHVLGDFSKSETWVPRMLDALADHIELLASGSDASYQNKVAIAMQSWKSAQDE